MHKIEDTSKAPNDTKALCIVNGILSQIPFFHETVSWYKNVVIADTNIYRVVGKRIFYSS